VRRKACTIPVPFSGRSNGHARALLELRQLLVATNEQADVLVTVELRRPLPRSTDDYDYSLAGNSPLLLCDLTLPQVKIVRARVGERSRNQRIEAEGPARCVDKCASALEPEHVVARCQLTPTPGM
jgi:hypothetical protein